MAGVEAFSGFLCPACPGHVKLDTQEQLVEHWRTLHDDAGAVPPSKPHVPKVGDATFQYLTHRQGSPMGRGYLCQASYVQ